MEQYSSGDPIELGLIEVEGRKGVVMWVEDGAFSGKNQTYEVIEVEDENTYYVLLNRTLVTSAIQSAKDPLVGAENCINAAARILAWHLEQTN